MDRSNPPSPDDPESIAREFDRLRESVENARRVRSELRPGSLAHALAATASMLTTVGAHFGHARLFRRHGQLAQDVLDAGRSGRSPASASPPAGSSSTPMAAPTPVGTSSPIDLTGGLPAPTPFSPPDLSDPARQFADASAELTARAERREAYRRTRTDWEQAGMSPADARTAARASRASLVPSVGVQSMSERLEDPRGLGGGLRPSVAVEARVRPVGVSQADPRTGLGFTPVGRPKDEIQSYFDQQQLRGELNPREVARQRREHEQRAAMERAISDPRGRPSMFRPAKSIAFADPRPDDAVPAQTWVPEANRAIPTAPIPTSDGLSPEARSRYERRPGIKHFEPPADPRKAGVKLERPGEGAWRGFPDRARALPGQPEGSVPWRQRATADPRGPVWDQPTPSPTPTPSRPGPAWPTPTPSRPGPAWPTSASSASAPASSPLSPPVPDPMPAPAPTPSGQRPTPRSAQSSGSAQPGRQAPGFGQSVMSAIGSYFAALPSAPGALGAQARAGWQMAGSWLAKGVNVAGMIGGSATAGSLVAGPLGVAIAGLSQLGRLGMAMADAAHQENVRDVLPYSAKYQNAYIEAQMQAIRNDIAYAKGVETTATWEQQSANFRDRNLVGVSTTLGNIKSSAVAAFNIAVGAAGAVYDFAMNPMADPNGVGVGGIAGRMVMGSMKAADDKARADAEAALKKDPKDAKALAVIAGLDRKAIDQKEMDAMLADPGRGWIKAMEGFVNMAPTPINQGQGIGLMVFR